MALAAQMVDGKIVANYTTETTERKTGNDSLDKDAFLQILVAEMQYQDPLQPSSNTEWVTQMSSFTQIEELQSVGDSIKEQGATDLVGKRVILAQSDEHTGDTSYVTGVVQCIEKLSDGVYLSIDDNLYNVDKLYSVVDDEYYEQLMKDAEKSEK
jgi:flagellar basal-body rod modification protein FlgD